ncbi:MAG: phycobiliprotein lyase [Methylacidiphilales bacterium]|nr:phycobiliprotein lyase [Candidatus Methylacidiphilales bacterium]NJR14400.1 phycobiliprotein lyase [Calothrix sp. CSU_2_0]
MPISEFQKFFDNCVGNWTTERTYHYLTQQEVERSHTEFNVEPITDELKLKVIQDNNFDVPADLSILPGYHLEFQTVSEKGEKVSQQLNMLFVTQSNDSTILQGKYLRDRAYEEERPIIADFHFDATKNELLMTTNYTRVVAVDSILMINPSFRIRRILSYRRPPEGQSLEEVVLVGFGVEQKS